MYFELLFLLGVDQGAGHVGRQQVGGELDAAELAVDSLGEGADRQGLGQARHAFEQDVPVGKHRDHQVLHQVLLPDDHLAHLQRQEVDERALFLDAFVQLLDVYTFHIIH